ncbi:MULTISPECIES: class F sortase [unclassified Rathayibacter]|uniref:class F sortase n=1 Tax=unclassified Rathayibacter TaxID=2609250 RepID=UPI00188A5324|nr:MULTISPECIES: class F sortase [unclassified Rathayibacter]MBF4462745.1 class F sortase [Rathayibacter sp. VKM Ac-2879]MBF4504159.1 class F sortase [Rathayibacter sp. VKM Ac-2878]
MRGALPWLGLAFAGSALAVGATLVVLQVTASPSTRGSTASSLASAVAGAQQAGPGATGGPAQASAAAADPVASEAPPVAGQPEALRIPSVGLDATVRTLSVDPGSVVDPPGPDDAYWLSDYGVAGPAATNTVYLAGHSYRRGGAVFNPLLDPPHERSAVATGDAIEVQTPEAVYRYTVTDVQRYDKATVGSEDELWRRVPGRLVLVTCFQYDDGQASTQNLVVYASLDRQ